MERWVIAALGLVLAGAPYAVAAAAQERPTPDNSRPTLEAPRSESSPEAAAQSNMKRDPHSGTMVPESSRAPEGQGESAAQDPGPGVSRMRDMAQVPAGIGERGTGQTQSTLERSGGGSGAR